MSRQFNLVYDMPPVSLLPPAADAAGRSSPYRNIRAADKAFIVVHVNQGSAAPVTLTPLQSLDVSGTSSKGMNAMPIWLCDNTATSDAFVQQPAAASFTTDATVADKIVVFEILPEAAMDVTDQFDCLAVSTSASNAANITTAHLQLSSSYHGASPLSTYVNN